MNAEEILRRIADEKPLVHHMTNYVTVDLVANVTLCVGALPVMAQAREEVEEMASVASALVLNIGTLDPQTVDSMLAAGEKANERGIPVLLDPVGAGATTLRTETVERLISALDIAVICGNAGEISTIAGIEAEVRGVESIGGDARSAVAAVAGSLGTIVCATGPTDYVSDGEKLLAVESGHPLMGKIVGSGCASTAAIASFTTAGGSDASVVADALDYYGQAGERAAKISDGPGTFQPRFLDALSELAADPDELDTRSRVTEIEVTR